MELNGKDAITLKFLGVNYAALNDMDRAIEYFKKSLEFNPEDADTWGSLGVVYLAKDRLQETIESFVKVREIEPENEIYKNLYESVLNNSK